MSNIRISSPNWISWGYSKGVISTSGSYCGTAAPGMPITEMLNDEPSARTRIISLDPSESRVGVRAVQLGLTLPMDAVYAVNTNLSRYGKYRMLVTSADGGITYERIAPNAEEASTNRTGAVTDVDEDPVAPDANWMTPTASAAWSTRLSFPTPTVALKSGSDNQAFVLWVKKSGSADIDFPTCNVKLFEAGGEVVDLGTKTHQRS